MPTPSNSSGLPTVPIVALLALILFLGFALAPRAFEFRAWPELSRPGAVQEIVSRPAAPAIEVPVARVKTRDDDALAVRGRNSRRGSRAPAREGRAVTREPARPRAAAPRGSRGTRTTPPAPSNPVAVVEEGPVPEPIAPVNPPERPAQLAEVPVPEQVLRPAAERMAPEQTPEPLADLPLPYAESREHSGRDDDSH